jgi:hypothetical protein
MLSAFFFFHRGYRMCMTRMLIEQNKDSDNHLVLKKILSIQVPCPSLRIGYKRKFNSRDKQRGPKSSCSTVVIISSETRPSGKTPRVSTLLLRSRALYYGMRGLAESCGGSWTEGQNYPHSTQESSSLVIYRCENSSSSSQLLFPPLFVPHTARSAFPRAGATAFWTTCCGPTLGLF